VSSVQSCQERILHDVTAVSTLSFQYHADRTFFYKTGAKGIAVVEDAYCYHNNPDTAKEIFRRNYLIGRTFLAVMYRRIWCKRAIICHSNSLG
jgi:hypothetical protein